MGFCSAIRCVFFCLLASLALGCTPAKVCTVEGPAVKPLRTVPPPDDNSGIEGDRADILATGEKGCPSEGASGSEALLDDAGRRNEGPDVSEDGESRQAALDAALGLCEASQESWAEGNLERAINALDQAYALILAVDPGDDAQLIQQKEDLRFMISKRILEIHASQCTAVNGNHNAIPLIMNQHVQYEIESFQGREREFFTNAYRRSGIYRPRIVETLKEAGLPEELSWLPFIESGFKVRALSPARALGLWQFIPSTGYKFGLSRDLWIDERMDPVKSTAAAIDYLKELHEMFGDWTTVLAAYNCGEMNVLRVIREQKLNYLDNFWDLYERLPRETARYVPRFLATLHIINNPAAYGMGLDEPEGPLGCDVVTVDRQVHLQDVAQRIGVPFADLCQLNAELRHHVTPASAYPLRVPPDTAGVLMARLDGIPQWFPPVQQPKRAYVRHRVRKGESLSSIALKYHTSVEEIIEANSTRRKGVLAAGEEIKIPGTEAEGKGVATRASRSGPLPARTYRVQEGDSLWSIAQRFSTTTKAIKRSNDLPSTRVHVGQVLKVPRQGEVLQPKAAKTYRVRHGDSPATIAQKNKVPLSQLLRANNLSLDCTIRPGQVLKVPN